MQQLSTLRLGLSLGGGVFCSQFLEVAAIVQSGAVGVGRVRAVAMVVVGVGDVCVFNF